MGWEPALPPTKCFEGAFHFQVGLHRDLRLQAAGAQYLRPSYDLAVDYVKLGLMRPNSGFLRIRTGRSKRDRFWSSQCRIAVDGTTSGGGSFGRGHIHHILTNPLYAGRIRHRKTVHDGQHPALIDRARWDRIQEMLQDGAAKDRRSRPQSQSSLLCGKLFDERGDRLTPSHTKAKSGKRLRYYISHRLMQKAASNTLTDGACPHRTLRPKLPR